MTCPVCSKQFTSSEIEEHVNRCLFLNTQTTPSCSRKRNNSSNETMFSASKKYKSDNVKNLNESSNNLSAINDNVSSKIVSNNSITLDCFTPLAEQMRPGNLNDYVGQENILGSSTILRTLLEKGDITSMILWGPPGCGKTTLAHIIACNCRSGRSSARFVKMSAVTSKVADVKDAVQAAKNELTAFKRRTILFMDEIHHFNKLQQDIFLPHVESGCIILIGATTENPSFSLNSALLSRCRVFVLEKLSSEHVSNILLKTLERLSARVVEDSNDIEGDKSREELVIERGALQWLADVCDGDARIALNSLQLAFQKNKELAANTVITCEDVQESIKRSHLLHDRAGEEHYNLISAVHKSIRASDENATLYWLTRMLMSGEDPRFIARRLIRAASEDIGLADPASLTLAVSTMQGCQLLGMPESDVLLAQCAVHLARAPKSREINNALAKAKAKIQQHHGPLPSVPLHLRNAPTLLMEQLGYGRGYSMNPADVPDMTYMPEGMENIDFFGT